LMRKKSMDLTFNEWMFVLQEIHTVHTIYKSADSLIGLGTTHWLQFHSVNQGRKPDLCDHPRLLVIHI
jgi:hypothetical protein